MKESYSEHVSSRNSIPLGLTIYQLDQTDQHTENSKFSLSKLDFHLDHILITKQHFPWLKDTHITKASSGGALAGVPVYFRRNISSGGGERGSRQRGLLGAFSRPFLRALLEINLEAPKKLPRDLLIAPRRPRRLPRGSKIHEKSMPRGILSWISNLHRFLIDFNSQLGPSEAHLALAG